MTDKSRLIQKYNNRRLYDTLEHRYITLQDVHQLVLNNVEFTVLDRQSRADITISVLLDVIAASHSMQRTAALDRDFLVDVIRKYCVSSSESDRANADTGVGYISQEPALLAH